MPLAPEPGFVARSDSPLAASGAFVSGSGRDAADGPLSFKTTVRELHNTLRDLCLGNDGDDSEKEYWPVIAHRFPNYERFWHRLVVPMTKRIEIPLNSPGRHERREGIADDLWRVSYLNYSAFLHLAYAFDHLPLPLKSSFGDFYRHLGSVCDLAEDFLVCVHLLVSECRNNQVPLLQGLSREEYLDMAARWYEKEYPKAYAHYHRKGKSKSLHLPPREALLGKYFEHRDEAWKAYTKFSGQIRPYRNRVVHDVAMGTVLAGRYQLVPKKERIQDYGDMRPIQDAAKDIRRLKRDFIVREEQMSDDLHGILTLLNALWEKPIADLDALLFEERNAALLKKYNLELVDG